MFYSESRSASEVQEQKFVEKCCKNKDVPHKCMGICMDGCKETPPEILKLKPPNSACKEFEKMIEECCKMHSGMIENHDLSLDLIEKFSEFISY